MPRLPEVTAETAAPAIAELLRAQQRSLGQPLNATLMMGHCPGITEASIAMGKAVDGEGHIEAPLRYLLNVHVAGLNGCPFWLDLNAFRGMQAGLTEAQVDHVHEHATSEHFSMRERLALEYAERITLSDQDVDEPFFARLRAEFHTPAAIVQLTAVIAFENFRSKFNHALGVESNGVCLLRP